MGAGLQGSYPVRPTERTFTEKKHPLSLILRLLITMSHIIRLGPNATLRLIPPSPDCCDTCKLTDRSPLKIIIPSLAQRLANLKRKQHSSSSESSDSGLPPVPKKSQRRTKKTGDKSDTPRLTIKTQPLQQQTPTAVDDKDESDDGNVPDDEAEEEEEESQSLAEADQAVSDAQSLRTKIRLPKRQTDTAKDDNNSDGKSQEKQEDEEDEDSYQEDSSSESSDESEDEYIPPRKRQRRCLQTISNLSSSRTCTSTSASSTSASAAKHDEGVQTL